LEAVISFSAELKGWVQLPHSAGKLGVAPRASKPLHLRRRAATSLNWQLAIVEAA
jgi:hypothetical protein